MATTVIIRRIGSSFLRILAGVGNAQTKVVTPSTKPIFAMFEPSALPIAKTGLPLEDEIMDTRISGADVPRATMVSPIIREDMPRLFASDAAP